jgi:hypothetical protein
VVSQACAFLLCSGKSPLDRYIVETLIRRQYSTMTSRSGYTTRLNPVECVLKAQAAIVAEPSVVGLTTDSLVLVRKLKTNTFHTVVRVKLKPAAEGTGFTLTAGMDRVVFVFGCIFLSAFLAISVAFLLAYLRVFQSFQFSDEDRRNWLFLSLPLICAVLGVALAQLGRHQSRDEAPFLTRLIVDALDAKSTARQAGPVEVKPRPGRTSGRPARAARVAEESDSFEIDAGDIDVV